MLKDHRDIIVVLNASGAKYLVVGGHAVSIHAEPRGTKELDLFIKADEENSKAELADYGAPLAGTSPADLNDKPTTVFQMGLPPARVDILQAIAGVSSMKTGRAASKVSFIGKPQLTSFRANT